MSPGLRSRGHFSRKGKALFSQRGGGLLQLGDEGAELLRLLPLVLDDVGGGLGGEGLVRQLRLDALEVALGLGLLLGDALPLLLEVHQLRERQKDPCGVGDDLHHAFFLHVGTAPGLGGGDHMDLACGGEALEEGGSGGEDVTSSTSAFLEGGTFISARRARMARMASMTISIASSSAGKDMASSYTGQAVHIRKSLSSPETWGRAW